MDGIYNYNEGGIDSAKKELEVDEEDYKVVVDKLKEKSRKAEIAKEVYFMYSGAGSNREYDLLEEVVLLWYVNEKKRWRNWEFETEIG